MPLKNFKVITSLALVASVTFVAHGSQVSNPIVTASATPYSTAYEPTNLFAPGAAEYASKGQGACTVPLTTTVGNGTWVEMDFGSNVNFDRFIVATRQDTSDVVGTNVLYVGTNAVHSTNDPYIFTFSSAGSDSSGPIRSLGSVSGRYARWEVLSAPGTTKNLGGRHMWFLITPTNSIILPPPTTITNTAAPVYCTTPYSSPSYIAPNIVDGNCGNGADNNEYAINGTTSGSNSAVIVFDFTTTNVISGFDYLNRELDLNTSFNLIYSDDPTFTVNLATNSWTTSTSNGNAWTTGVFSNIAARFVMFQATSSARLEAGIPNPGGREIIFYGPSNQPPFIVQQPPASTNIDGNLMVLKVAVPTNGLSDSFQWEFNGTNLSDGPSVSGSGATVTGSATAALTITNATPLDSGDYTVIVSNSLGVVTSSVCDVTIFAAPTIGVEPAPTNIVTYVGGSTTISVVAFGSLPISYDWYSNNTLVTVNTNGSFPILDAQATANYFAIASNSLGTATSAVVSVTVVPLPTSPYPLTVLGDHPIGYWPLNEVPDNGAGNDGTLANDYIAANDGVYSNVILGLPGYGYGLAAEYSYAIPTDTNSSAEFGVFAPENSYVAQIPNINFSSSSTAPSFSVEAWVNANGIPQVNAAGIVNKGYGGGGEQFTIDYYNGDGWRFYVRNAAGTSTVAESLSSIDSNWHHLIGVLDSVHSSIIIYVDGVAAGTTAFSPVGGILSSSYPVAIGSRTSSAGSAYTLNFSGQIENVAIYNYALTPAQVENHYLSAGITPFFTLQPPSSTNLNEGATLTVTAAAVGASLSYQWYDATSGSPGTPLAGQTNTTLVINDISGAYNGHSLDLAISNAYGQATSSQIYLNVQTGPPFSVTVGPSSTTIYGGVSATFSAAAQGSPPFSYQWSVDGVNVQNATNAVFANAPLSPGSYTIGCVVTNTFGLGSPAPATATLTVITPPSDAYASAILADAPIAFWRLDEPANATTAYDYAGGHDATYFNATNGLPGFRPLIFPSETASGFGMDGFTNDSLALENNNAGNGLPLIDFSTQGSNAEFSVEAWVKAPPPQNANGAGIVAKGAGHAEQFALDVGADSGVFRFFARNGASVSSAAIGTVITDGNWHYLAGVCDQTNGTVYLYVDGVMAATNTIAPGTSVLSTNSSSFPVSIGSRALSVTDSRYTDQLTNASISQVALYDYPLSPLQVAAHYSVGFVSLAIQNASQNTVLITWPVGIDGLVLQEAADLSAPVWMNVTNTVNVVNGQNQIELPATSNAIFYRLTVQ